MRRQRSARVEPRPGAADRVREGARKIAGAVVPAVAGGASGRPAQPNVKTAAAVVDASKAPEVVKAVEPQPEPRKPGTGLRAEIWKYKDQELRDFPEVDKKVPALVRVDPKIEFPNWDAFKLSFLPRNLAIRWRGFLFIGFVHSRQMLGNLAIQRSSLLCQPLQRDHLLAASHCPNLRAVNRHQFATQQLLPSAKSDERATDTDNRLCVNSAEFRNRLE